MKTVEKYRVLTGVISLNSLNTNIFEDIFNEKTINTGLEHHLEHCNNADHENCDYDNSICLIGFEKDSKGNFLIAKNSEYSYICDIDTNYIQVVNSKYALPCKLCSPCYPNQGDLDSEGEDVYAFCLPIEFYEDCPTYDRVKEQMLEVIIERE